MSNDETKFKAKGRKPAGRTHAEKIGLGSFSERLKQARLDRGLSQSDLARDIWGEMADTRGYMVARNRDRISAWESGRAVPEEKHLQALADVLGIDRAVLAPDLVAEGMDRRPAAISMTMLDGGFSRVHLQINTLASLEVASQVVALLSKDPLVREVSEKK